jgi:NhaA family Na+:H+ antiporter
MKSHHHHAISHIQPIVLRHRRREGLVVRVFQFCSDHFLLFPIGAVVALVWCNVASESYFTFALAFRFLVNDVGMAIFFALIAQEIVEAVMPHGALHSWRRWGPAVLGAAGGILGAALSYLGWVHAKSQLVLAQAWPIACAVDIVVAYYVLKAIFRKSVLLPFVLLLGITTNLFSAIVVALRGTAVETQAMGMLLALLAVGVAMLFRAWRVPTFWPYLAIGGTISWWAFYWIGVYPAFAFLPIVPLLPHAPRKIDLLAPPRQEDATHRFEHEWHHLVQLILFFFGVVNAGVVLQNYDVGTWALLAASLVGRPAGILAAIGLGVAVGLQLPRRIGWRELLVAALATSSSFTFALFYTSGLLATGPVREQIAMGALATMIGAALTFAAARGLKVGRYAGRRRAAPTEAAPRPEGRHRGIPPEAGPAGR